MTMFSRVPIAFAKGDFWCFSNLSAVAFPAFPTGW